MHGVFCLMSCFPKLTSVLGSVFLLLSLGTAADPVVFRPVPKLNSVSMSFLQRGKTHQISLSGDSLDAFLKPILSHTGLQVRTVSPTPSLIQFESSAGGIAVLTTDLAKTMALEIKVAPEMPLGPQELRFSGLGGVSNPLILQITDVPEITEPKGTDSMTDAPLLTLPVGIAGRITGSAQSDNYRFTLKEGEEILLDVQANRMGSPLDATLRVLDAEGKELAKSEDVHGLDPFLVFKAPQYGFYGIRLNDLRNLGGDNYTYHLVVGKRPYVESIFPFGGRRGSAVEVQLNGHTLEGSDRMTLSLASEAPLGRQEIRARTSNGTSNPVGFEVGDLPELREVEPNDTAEKATPASGPMVLNGRIEKSGDNDIYRFKSPSDQRWIAEVFARRFGSPLDPLLTLQDARGNLLQRNDDANGPDARLEFDAKKDTEYLLSIRDLTDRGGASFGYRLTLKKPDLAPSFSAKASVGRVRIHQDGWLAIRCEITRRNGYDGMVRIVGADLPAGVWVVPGTAGVGSDIAWLLVGAHPEAQLGSFPLRLQALGEHGGKALKQPVQLSEAGWLTLLPMAPFSVDLGQASASLEQNATLPLDVAIVRRTGFTGEIKVIAEGPSGVTIPSLTLAPDQSRGRLQVTAAYNAATGTSPIALRAEALVDGQTVVQSAPRFTDLTLHGIPLYATAMLPGSPFFRTDAVKLSAVALPTNSVSSANRSEFVVKVDRRGYEGEVTLLLDGVPKGVIATVAPILAKAKEASVNLVVTEQAVAGKAYAIGISVTFTHADRIWHQKTTPISLTITAPVIETTSTNAPATNTPAASKFPL